jgi:hypothetical protein
VPPLPVPPMPTPLLPALGVLLGGGSEASALHASTAQAPRPKPNHFVFKGSAFMKMRTFPYSG